MDSQSSCTSSVPNELIVHDDPMFIDELETVNTLYFGNVEISDSECESPIASDNDANIDSDYDGDDDDYSRIDCNVEHACPSSVDPEEVKQNNFKTSGCECNRLYGKPCSAVVDWDQLIDYRLSCLEKTKDELDLVIKFQLFHHRHNASATVGQKRKAKIGRNLGKLIILLAFWYVVHCLPLHMELAENK